MKPKVLFIEDDTDQVILFKTKFELEGFEVITAGDGVAGVMAAKKNDPGLIFLDILLPGENGLVVLKKLKQDEMTKTIPVVLYTNFADKISREEGIKLGAVDYFVKTDIGLNNLVDWVKKNIKFPLNLPLRKKRTIR